jgi:hypothetical protein
MAHPKSSRLWLLRLILLLWGLQVAWLAWHFGGEIRELGVRVAQGEAGEAIRQEDSFYRWLAALAQMMPPQAAYVFLDNYEAGKDIEARYHLAPRRHVLLPPEVPASFLFYFLRREKASFLIVRDQGRPLGPGARAAIHSPALRPLDLSGLGLVFRVDWARLHGDFYD